MRQTYDKTHNRIFEEVSEELSLPLDEIKKVYGEFWKAAATHVKDPNDYSMLRVPNFGNFNISRNKLYNKISYVIEKYKAGEMNRGSMIASVRVYWQILEHLRKHKPRTGVNYKRRLMEKYGANTWEEAKKLIDGRK